MEAGRRADARWHRVALCTRTTPNKGMEPTRRSARLMPGVCAVHAVMLGGASPLSRCAWSRRTREAPGRHREVGSEGRAERMCGARDTNPIGGVVPSGRAGTRPQSPPSTISHSRQRRILLKMNNLSLSAFVNIKLIESTTYVFYGIRNASSFDLSY